MLLKKLYVKWAVLLALALVGTGCSTISTFDQYAYQQATNLKVVTLAVMDLAGEKDLAQLRLLKAKGMAQINLDEFTNGLIDLVAKTAVSVI